MYYKEIFIIRGRIRRTIEQGTPRHFLGRAGTIVPEWGKSYMGAFGTSGGKYFYFPATEAEYKVTKREQGKGDLLRSMEVRDGWRIGGIDDAGQLVPGFKRVWCPNRHQRKHSWQAMVTRLKKDAGLC